MSRPHSEFSFLINGSRGGVATICGICPTQQWGELPITCAASFRGRCGSGGITALSGLVRLSLWYNGIKFSLRSLSTQPEEAHAFLWVSNGTFGRVREKCAACGESRFKVTFLLAARSMVCTCCGPEVLQCHISFWSYRNPHQVSKMSSLW